MRRGGFIGLLDSKRRWASQWIAPSCFPTIHVANTAIAPSYSVARSSAGFWILILLMARQEAEFVSDWGGFEELVAQLCDDGTVSVHPNEILVGKSGTPRQIDVVLRHRQGLVDHLVVVECKHWSKPVRRANVDALATTLRDVNASRGIIFSTSGFQAGAIAQARFDGIDLFKVRALGRREWGSLDKNFPLRFQHVWRIFQNLTLPGIHCWEKDLSYTNINVFFEPDGTQSALSSTVGSEAWNSRDLKSRPH